MTRRKCPACGEVVTGREIDEALGCCPECGYDPVADEEPEGFIIE